MAQTHWQRSDFRCSIRNAERKNYEFFYCINVTSYLPEIPSFLLLLPHTVRAMEEENSAVHDHIFLNPFEIRAIAKFRALNGKEKDFARYIKPFRIYHDDDGNVHFIDASNISFKRDKYSPILRRSKSLPWQLTLR